MDKAVPATSKTPLIVKMYPWESRHEWVARISFVEDHLPTYGFERALSLSMVWANMKFLGCRYPNATEQLVMHYSVPETDKSRSFPANGCYVINAEDFPDGIPLGSFTRDENDDGEAVKKEENDSDTATQVSMLISNIRERVETEKKQGADTKPAAAISPEMSEICCKLVLPQVISKEDHPVSVLTVSCQKANFTLSFAFKEHIDKSSKHPTIIGYQATILIDDAIVGKGDSYSTKKDAKKHACQVVIERIKSFQDSTGYAPAPLNSECIEKSEILQGNESVNQQPVSMSGVGGQLLRKMGWSEEDSAQASQPFDSHRNPGRSGLGFAPQPSSTLRQNVEQKLHEFVNSDKDELVFSAEFSVEERKMIHNLCTQYKLNHKSHGKGDERKLVIQKRLNTDASTTEHSEQSKYNQHYEFHHSYEQPSPPQQRTYKGRPTIQSGFFQHAVDKASRSHPYQDNRQQQQQHHPHQMWEGRRR